jgi:hypothetical protein
MALVLVCFAAGGASAQLPEHVEISWDDDGSCPRPLRLSLESEIARILGPGARTIPPARFEVRVVRRSDGGAQPYQLTLSVQRAAFRGQRELAFASCSDSQDAAALLIATAIDPTAVMRTPPRESPPPREPAAPPRPVVAPHPWSLLARGLFDVSSLPAVSAGLEAGVLHARARYRLWSEARYLFAQKTERTGSGVAADVDLFAAAAGGAYVWPFGALVVGPAAELELGVLRGQGAAVRDGLTPQNQVGPWGALHAGGIAGIAVHRRVGLELSLFGGLPLWRPQLAVRGDGAFYTTRAATMRVAVGVRVSLGSL